MVAALLVCMETIYLDINSSNETVIHYVSLGYNIVFVIFE